LLAKTFLAFHVPFFSVITPSFNQGSYIETCIRSILEQNDPGFEHLIFDNCSKDTTAEIASRYPHITFISESDRGQSHAVNKGLAASRGEIICWLNSDDEYEPGAFAALREAFSDPAVQVVFGDVRQIEYDGRGGEVAHGKFDSRLDLIRWWSSRVKLHQPSIFFRREAAVKSGPVREDLHYAMDYELWWRMSGLFDFRYIPRVLAVQHRQPDSKTISQWHKVLEERECIFSPFYDLIDDGKPSGLKAERRRCLAKQYLIHAWTDSDPAASRNNLLRAWKQSPAEVLRPSSLGLIWRIFS